jgi:hypothetical protein
MGDDDFEGSLEDIASMGSDNFWGFGGYKFTLKRISTGVKLCEEVKELFAERYHLRISFILAHSRLDGDCMPYRASIEKAYSKALGHWVDKWRERVDKIGEFGTLRGGWHHILHEARAVADLHHTIKVSCKDLCDPCIFWFMLFFDLGLS